LHRAGRGAVLYLQCLAAARRDDSFSNVLAAASPDVRNDPDTLRTVAAHAWNIGDLVQAEASVGQLLMAEPDNPFARVLKIEIFLRQNRSSDLLNELDKPIEKLPNIGLKEQFRVVSILGRFGYIERSVAQAYRLFLENQDNSQAWMVLSTLVLSEGRSKAESKSWEASVVAPDIAVNLRYDDGEELFVVIEPDAELRRLDVESWEPGHPLVQTLKGLKAGDRFAGQGGREGTVVQLRHKYVARLQYVMQNHETRFPEIFGFRRVAVDVTRPDGLEALIEKLKARREWFEEEQEQYRNGPWPLGVFAHRVGLDTIDAAGWLASRHLTLKVAIGEPAERESAARIVRENRGKGCVLDLLAFWTAWQLNALDTVREVGGPIQLTRGILDRLRERRDRIAFSVGDGLRSADFDEGKLILTETTPEVIRTALDDVNGAIAWAEANAAVCPLVANNDLPADLREHLRSGSTDIFESLTLAILHKTLLVTDDLPTRDFGRALGFQQSTWLHQLLSVSPEQKRIDFDTFVRWSAQLIGFGHNYIGVSGLVLERAVHLDFKLNETPGSLFNAVVRAIGGKNAEPRSHIVAVLGCLRSLWSDSHTTDFREPYTGLLLEQLISERYDDYAAIVEAIIRYVSDLPRLIEYIKNWARGHFLQLSAV
jgi:cellulose synthase operon protein C